MTNVAGLSICTHPSRPPKRLHGNIYDDQSYTVASTLSLPVVVVVIGKVAYIAAARNVKDTVPTDRRTWMRNIIHTGPPRRPLGSIIRLSNHRINSAASQEMVHLGKPIPSATWARICNINLQLRNATINVETMYVRRVCHTRCPAPSRKRPLCFHNEMQTCWQFYLEMIIFINSAIVRLLLYPWSGLSLFRALYSVWTLQTTQWFGE